MSAFLIANMAPIMFASLVVVLLLGYPAAFSLGAVGLIYAVVGIQLGEFRPDFLQALPERIYGVMNNDTLLAIPFFTFMGLVLERSGMAEDLLDTIGQLFGTVSGGLAYAVVFVGALLAATTGVVAASVISMGLISLPIMLRYGYDRRMATGIIAASGTLAQIIPPSLVLIVMADQLGKSVGDMYEGAFIPGLVLAGLYAVYAFIVTLIFPKAAPGLPPEAIGFREKDGSRGLFSLVVLFIASCVFGWFMMRNSEIAWRRFRRAQHVLRHPVRILCRGSELDHRQVHRLPLPVRDGAADHFRDGAAAVPDLPGAGHDLHRPRDADRRRRDGRRRRDHPRRREAPAKLGSDPAGRRIHREALGFRGLHPGRRAGILADLLRRQRPRLGRTPADLAARRPGRLSVFVNAFVFVLAFFLDFFELAFIVIPLLGPAAEHLGIDLIWFGVILGVNMQTSFMHPPFGFALFYLRSVAPKDPYLDRVTGKRMEPVTTGQIYWGAVPFVVIQVIMVLLVIIFPSMVMHYKGALSTIDPNTIKIEVPQFDLPPLDFGPPAKQ